jgi:uncharacterized DUF497 family protein
VRDYEFRWNAWNIEHVARHAVTTDEAESVVNHAGPPYPTYRGDGKWLVIGQTLAGRYLQVVFVLDPDDVVYVIHARSITDAEKRRYRRRRRR